MNRLFVTLFFSLSLFTASSQKIYFIYLQTDPQQPFFVKMDEKLFSSSASGYLVLPRLRDSTYLFSVGFNGGGEYKFACTVNKKDHGFLIKNFGEKGWGLYDLQTSEVQMAVTDTRKETTAVNTPVNAFTELLSKAADDSTLKQKVVLPVEEKKPEVLAVAKAENTIDSNAFKTAQQKNVVNGPKTEIISSSKTETSIPVKEEPKKETVKITDSGNSKTVQPKSTAEESKIVTTPATNAVSDQKVEVSSETKDQAEEQPMSYMSGRDSIKQIYDDADMRLDSIIGTNEDIMGQFSGSLNEIKKTKKQIADILREKTSSKSQIANAKALASKDLNDKIDNLEKEIASLRLSAKEKANVVTIEKPAIGTTKAVVQTESDVYTKSKVVRKSESSTTDGFGLTFIDISADGKQDTISLVIPNDNSVKLSDARSSDLTTTESKSEPIAEKEPKKAIAKNTCKSTATDDDFFKLRKKMAAQKSDNGMIQEAAKIFKTKCFTTSQLKNLATLFIGDGGKYQFFDAAYSHVSDIENFSSLETELKDEYFLNRFKAMLR